MELFKKTKYHFNIFRITLVNIRITFSSDDYRKWAKKNFEQYFCIIDWDLKTVFYLFPFIFGFSKMLLDRYQEQTFSLFFEKTCPRNKILKEEMSWETFKFLKYKKIQLNEIKNLHLYNDSFLIELNARKKIFNIGFFVKPEKKIKREINSKKIKIVLTNFIGFSTNETRSKRYFLNQIYHQLDELPLKIDEISEKKSFKNSVFDIELNNLKKEIFLVEKKNSSPKTNKSLLVPNTFTKLNFFLTNLTFGLDSTKNNSNNFVFKTSNNLKLKNIYQRELENLFYKYNLQPFDKVKVEKRNLKKVNSISSLPKETLRKLTDNLPIQINKFLLTRQCSGYYYPDLRAHQLKSLYLKVLLLFFRNSFLLKINIPSSFLYSVEENSTYYSLFFKNFKRKTRKEGFSDSILEQNLLKKKDKSNFKISLLKEIFIKEYPSFEDLNELDSIISFLLYRQIYKNTIFEFERNKTNFSIIQNRIKKSNKIKYNFNLFNENLLNNHFNTLDHFGEVYKRIPNFSINLKKKKDYFQKTNFNFFESWEPISSHSWIILMQFSVGLLLLHLIKDLYKDYGKELVDYILEFASSSGIDIEEIKEQYFYNEPGYRLIKNVNKTFKDIAGIDKLLPELAEIVWFLRNAGRSSKYKKSIPKGILLTGPPGTGKTLLVQAIAGEAQVPVIVEAGSLLSDPHQKGRGIEKLKKIFDQARQLKPCLVFIDEVDTIGEKRKNIIQTTMGGDELIESIYQNYLFENESLFISQAINRNEEKTGERDLEYKLFRGSSRNKVANKIVQFQKNIEIKKTRLSLLTQFLIEIDGLNDGQGVIIIGATNRPNILDPALIRPGRFDKILNLELPGKNKRIEILKLYSKKLHIDKKLSWDYLANRTQGFSAADLAAAMNESAIQSILKNTAHNIETIERGIDLVTSYRSDSNEVRIKKTTNMDAFFLTQQAYYQAGKATLQTLLPNHPSVLVVNLWPRQKNTRHIKFSEKSFIQNKNRFDIESQLIGFYAGKAAELITLYGPKIRNSLKNWHSNIGIEDLLSGTFLAHLMIDKLFFYSNQVSTRKFNTILKNRNKQEFNEYEKVELLKYFDNQVENEIEIEEVAKLVQINRQQQRGFGPWWQIQVSKQISEIEYFFADWYRIYIPDPEESLLNLEWIPPDQFYHTNESLKKNSKKSDSSLNHFYQLQRDYIYHGLILNSFNQAFSELETMREFLDYFADYLIRYALLREDQIIYILKGKNLNIKKPSQGNLQRSNRNLFKDEKVLSPDWGKKSRRTNFRFFDLNKMYFPFSKTYFFSLPNKWEN